MFVNLWWLDNDWFRMSLLQNRRYFTLTNNHIWIRHQLFVTLTFYHVISIGPRGSWATACVRIPISSREISSSNSITSKVKLAKASRQGDGPITSTATKNILFRNGILNCKYSYGSCHCRQSVLLAKCRHTQVLQGPESGSGLSTSLAPWLSSEEYLMYP